VEFYNAGAAAAVKTTNGFQVESANGELFMAKKLVFATGIKDLLPAIEGLAECWGISAIHCPYCHGYEVRHERTGILGNGDMAFDFTRLISNWTKDLTLFTNGPAALTEAQFEKLGQHQVEVIENEIEKLVHKQGQLEQLVFKDGSRFNLTALYTPSPFEQHCNIPEHLGCALTEEGYIKTDPGHETTIEGIYAVGDNASKMRTVANAVAMGTAAGMH
jgi:thioredoxin reductase